MRRRVTLAGLLQAAAALTVFFSIVTIFDSAHHAIELFVHFRPQYLVIAVLLAVALSMLRNYAYAGVLLLTAALNGVYVLPWYFADVPQASGEPLKILHANVHSSSVEYDRVLELVADESPDIVFLQEVTDDWVAGTSALGSEYGYHYAEPREGNFGIAMFSRVPLDSVTHVDSPPLGFPTILAKARVSGRIVTLISTHPMIPLGRDGTAARNQQLDHAAELAAGAGGSVILIGDVNNTMWSRSYRSFVDASGLRNAGRGVGILLTWPVFLPFAMIPIDQAFVSEDIGIVELRKGAGIGSDHLPLVLTVAL